MPVQVAEGASLSGCVWFTRRFIEYWNLTERDCSVLWLNDDSMEPTIKAESAVLVDARRSLLKAGRLYAVRIPGEPPTVRCAVDEGGGWQLRADNPNWDSAPWSDEIKLLGQVVWTAHTLLWGES